MDILKAKGLHQQIIEPAHGDAFDAWIQQADVIPFLEQEITDENIIIYAALPFSFIHSALIPKQELTRSIIDDLQLWSCNPYNTWGLVVSSDNAWVEAPLVGSSSKTLSTGEQILFARSFEGVASRENYFEIEEKITHVLGLHNMPERNAWCRLDQKGDIEDIVKIYEVNDLPHKHSGTIITFNKNVLGEYATVGNYVLCRMFDFTRFQIGNFDGWQSNHGEADFTNQKDIFGRLVIDKGRGSYSRGIQVVNIGVPKQKIIDNVWGRSSSETNKHYATFIAHDWKNKRLAEISCDPSCLASYFEKSDLPFQTTPAFFNPEVLLKYKSDRDKYQLKDRSISCRGSWYLDTYDINEAGQVHTYLTYLGRLPYEEQLHWKAYNEEPKAPLSERAIATDFRGQWYEGYDPLQSIKNALSELDNINCGWWKLRSKIALDKALYPFTISPDEWADEILNFDQLLIEGFEEKWLRQKAKELGRKPDDKLRELKLVEECLIGLGFEEYHAYQILTPLHDVHNLRSKLKSHATGTEAEEAKKQAIKDFGSYRQHFIDLCTRCDAALRIIVDAFNSTL